MIQLSEIEAAEPMHAMELRRKWKEYRGLSPVTGVPNDVMRYIERLEAKLSEAEKVITDLSKGVACVLRFNGSSEEYIAARLKQAHDLLLQHEREEAHGQYK